MSAPKTIKDLPIYGDSLNNKNDGIWVTLDKKDKSELETLVSSFRQNTCDLMKEFKVKTYSSIQYYETTKESVKNKVNYISSETNILPKLAFISLSGLSGLLIGYKKSAFRKLLYSSILTTGAAAICYPQEAKVYSNKIYKFGEENAKQIYREYIWPEDKKPAKISEKEEAKPKQIDSKDTIVKLDNETIKSSKTSKNIVGDKGQSKDEDKDLYTTRK